MAKNKYRAPKSKWKKWGKKGQAMFNEVYGMLLNKKVTATDLFGTSKKVKKVLRATRWNAAWIAADLVRKQNSK